MNSKTKIILIIVGVILAGYVINKMVKKEKEYNNNFTAYIPKDEATIKTEIKSLYLYIDFSGSMRGYVDFGGVANSQNANSTLISTVSNFLDNIESEYSIQTKSICGDNSFLKDEFRNAMEDRTVFNGGTTILHKMIAEKAAKANSKDVIAIVSDMVLSFGKPKLIEQNDNHYNKHHLDGLASAIHGAMTKVKSSGLDILLMQYYSDFNGNFYYNYTENIEDGDAYKNRLMKNRPFYIMLIGKKDVLKSILAKDCLKDAEQIYSSFTLSEEDLEAKAFEVEDKSGYWIKGDKASATSAGFWTSTNLKDNTTEYAISCHDVVIPPYLDKENLIASSVNGETTNLKYDKENNSLSFTFTTVPYKDLANNDSISVEIRSKRNLWGKESSISDDRDQKDKDIQGKTWGFESIINAIDEAFNGKKGLEDAIVGKFSFNLSKRK